MLVRLLLWSLADAKTTLDELRRALRDEIVDETTNVPGLRLKLWISDEAGERFGVLELWESADLAVLPANARERELLGKDPEVGEEFDLEASIEGRFFEEELSRRGMALEE
ncbi:MAG: hypothetical protein C4305_07455 [Thermoleophilia bacterium]